MTLIRVYRLALLLLPAELRRKHGPAMETLFARELAHARTRGWLYGALAGAAGVWDVMTRAIYEQVRPARTATGVSSPMDDPHKSLPTTRQFLRRLAASFLVAFVGLTSVLLLNYARRLPTLGANEALAGAMAKAVLLSVPFTAAMTIPMAMFVAVLYEFMRLGADGRLTAARHMGDGVRRLVVCVLAASLAVSALALVVTAEIVPRTNERLILVLNPGATHTRSDRAMTIGQLREAARDVGPSTQRDDLVRVANYELEIHKKFALPAACVVLALAAMAIALCFPRGGRWLVFAASLVMFSAYYVVLVAGEGMADRLVLSPFAGMWGANGLVLTIALIAVAWRRRGPLTPSGRGTVAIRG